MPELDGRGDALGDADAVALAEGETDSDGVGEADETSGVATGDESVVAESLGAVAAISPERPLSAASKALLAMTLGNGDTDVLSLGVALADCAMESDGEGDADAEALTLDDAELEGSALRETDVDGDALLDALGEIVSDGDEVADGDALAIGSTMQGSRGVVTCSVSVAGISAAMATEPVPKVAKIKLAETVIATPPVRRTPRVWACLRNAERRETADM